MTLLELSAGYGESALLLRGRIAELRQARQDTEDAELCRRLEQRIAALRPLLQEMRELQRLTAHYYDRRVQRNERYTL